jgi:[ribosomal protein S5]-alanine N-acetyltransferase
VSATRRIDLLPKTREDVQSMIDSMAPNERAQLSADWLARFAASTHADPWICGFSAVLRENGAVIGTGGFKGPPAKGVVEIAYAVTPDEQRKGYASEIAAGLVDVAFAATEVELVIAHTLPDGIASQRVLWKNGFVHVGEVIDPDDGLVWRFEKHRAPRK